MKTKILTKITLLLLLFTALSCSKESVQDESTTQKASYSITYDSKTDNNSQSNKITTITYKYLKVVYSPTSLNITKEFARDEFNAATTSSHNVTEMNPISFPNTDLWTFDQIDQVAVDALFNSSGGSCLLCNFVIETVYVDVIKVCYITGTTIENKEDVRDDFDQLMHVTLNETDCETWYMNDCCLSSEQCPINGITSYVVNVETLQETP